VRGALLVGDQDDLAAARRHLLHVGDGLLEQLVMRRDHDDRHVLVDQRDRAVLQLAGRIAFGVDVGDFLELQRAFQRQRIAGAAAEIEHVLGLRELARETFSICGFELQTAAIRRGASISCAPAFCLLLGRDRAARHAGAMASAGQHASWQVKALVEATPISARRASGTPRGFRARWSIRHVDDRAPMLALRLQ
jgi:hypothetical protein